MIVVEALCTAKRLRGDEALHRASAALDAVGLVRFDEKVRNRAAASRFEPALRALDAIHLATALSLGGDVDAFVAYDEGLCRAARAEGLAVVTPSPR